MEYITCIHLGEKFTKKSIIPTRNNLIYYARKRKLIKNFKVLKGKFLITCTYRDIYMTVNYNEHYNTIHRGVLALVI